MPIGPIDDLQIKMERQEWERESEKNMTEEKKEKLPLCVLENSLHLCTLACIFVATDGLWRWEEMGGWGDGRSHL